MFATERIKRTAQYSTKGLNLQVKVFLNSKAILRICLKSNSKKMPHSACHGATKLLIFLGEN